jgi:hypothetical protein
MLRRHPRFLYYGTSVFVLYALSGCNYFFQPNIKTPEGIVDQYLLALEKNDKQAIVNLLPKGSFSSKKVLLIVDKKLSQFNGLEARKIKVQYTELKEVYIRADMRGSFTNKEGMEKEFNETVDIRYESGGFFQNYKGRWRLLF